MRKIFTYIIILAVNLFFFFPSAILAQSKEKEEIEVDLWQGIGIEVDAFSAVMSIVNKETYSFEGNVQVNLKEKYFPIVEIGFAGANKLADLSYGTPGFKTNGAFARVGINYNLLKPNTPDTPIRRYIYVGLRYGFSNFSYSITDMQITDDYWGGTSIVFNKDERIYKNWLEIVGGLRVEVFKNVFLGWSVRRKIPLGKEKDYEPWYIPGIGIKSIGNWQFNYAISYNF